MDTRQTYNRLLPIVNLIDKSVTCQSVTDNTDGTYTFLCKYTKWATKGYDLTIGSETYNIEEVVTDVSIKVSGTVLPTDLIFNLYAPIFKHGTVRRVASEQNTKPEFKDRTPLIFLHEIVEEGLHFNSEDTVDSEPDCRIYFLTGCNFADWDQLQGDTEGIAPMRALCKEFLKALVSSQFVMEMTSIGRLRNFNVFGSEDEKGILRNWLNEFLSGVELRITIPFLKECDCCEVSSTPVPPVCAGVSILDQDNNVLIVVASGGSYQVTVFSGVQDTIDNNVTTILDNIINP